MSETVISIENVSKKYTLRHKVNGERYTTLRDVIARRAAAPFKAIGKKIGGRNGSNGSHSRDSSSLHAKNSFEDFWALKNVSLEIRQGDVIGVIGRNGAGKSTLLKILSRITEPTEGRITIRGRVASLLEVGTGFHPELTGRENVYLNGAILGMSRAEIKAKFDEIVAFAAVEQFLDTPVKRYSSGMYVRLAFAVAAHLEPEILIVDEVLAVGDAEFQKKCLGKMQDVATGGRTVLFVSHNMQAISVLCNRGMFLRSGSLEYIGSAKEAINKYISSYTEADGHDDNPDRRYGTGEYRYIVAAPGQPVYGSADEKVINFEIERRGKLVGKIWFCAWILDPKGVVIVQYDSRLVGFWVDDSPRIRGQIRFTTPWLKPGSYRVNLSLGATWTIDLWEAACSLTISPVLPYPNSAVPDASSHGLILGDFSWQASDADEESVSRTMPANINSNPPNSDHPVVEA
jgi:lipopolysaccharide transport system ATP-binding protein